MSDTERLYNAVLDHIIKAHRAPFEEFELFGKRWYYRSEEKARKVVKYGNTSYEVTRTCLIYEYGPPSEGAGYEIFHFAKAIKLRSNQYLPGTTPPKTAKGSRHRNTRFYKT